MNVSNTTQRLRGAPDGALGPGGRPIQDNRTGSNNSVVNGASGGRDRNASGPQMSRAEKFEDEKRRIIESCFGKKEPDGASELRATAPSGSFELTSTQYLSPILPIFESRKMQRTLRAPLLENLLQTTKSLESSLSP